MIFGKDIMLEEYLMFLRAGGAPETSLRARRCQIGRALRIIDKAPEAITGEDLVLYMASQRWAPESRKAFRSAIRGFYAWAVESGRIATDPTARLPRVAVPAGRPRPAPDDVFARAMLAATPRDRLMLMLAAYAGLRRAEISRVHSDNLSEGQLRIVGKGGKVRVIPMNCELAAALADVHGFAFPGKDAGHLSPDRVGVILKRLLGPGWSGHTLRHRFATRAHRATHDLLAVQTLLGHSSVATTQRYTAVDDQSLWDAIGGVA